MYTKRGQATIIILLGIVIVGLVVGVYTTKDYIFKSKLERLSEQSLVVPKQAESVKEYVMSCVKQVTEEAVDLAGQRGGRTKISKDTIPLSIHNKFSNSLEILPDLKVPYWYYKAANNVDKYQIPSLDQISRDLENYVDENLRICVGSFSGFKDLGYDISPGMIKSSVEIQFDKAIFEISFPIHMEIKDFKFDFTNFYYKVEKPLGELYDVARGLFTYSDGKYFLEEKTINMMVGSQEIPLTGEVFECGSVPVWNKFEVVENFKRGLSYNIPVLKIKGTDHNLNEEEKVYYEVDIGSLSDGVDISFVYSSSWPFQLEVEPEKDGLMKASGVSEGVAGKLSGIIQSIFCYTSWHFVYNVKYPVLITVTKGDYSFQYAMMVVIDKNEPRQNLAEPLPFFEPDTRFCDNEQYNIDVSVYDENGNSVNDVDLSYKCINHVCKLGKSVGNSFSGKVMPCSNGFLLANKEGYHYGKTQISTLQNSAISVVLKEYKEIDLVAEVLRGGSGKLLEDEQLFINLVNEEEDYSTIIVYPSRTKVKLIPGNYDVSLSLVKDSDDRITIPSKEVETCLDVPKPSISGVLGGTEEKCITTKIPSVELDRVIVGAADFKMSISKSDLDKGKITFFVPYQGIPHSLEDLSKINIGVDANFVYPRFS